MRRSSRKHEHGRRNGRKKEYRRRINFEKSRDR